MRTQELQSFLDLLREHLVDSGEEPGFVDSLSEAWDHPYSCRCDKCRVCWKHIGPDPDTGQYGPFTREEIE